MALFPKCTITIKVKRLFNNPNRLKVYQSNIYTECFQMQPVPLSHDDLLSRNHRDTNRKQNTNVRLKTTETGQVST